MNNEKMNQMIDEAYENYLKGGDIKWLKQEEVDTPIGKMNMPIPYTKEEFINKCKTDTEFSERWGLKIEERELSWKERVEIARKTLSKEEFFEYGNLSPFTTPIITYWLNQNNIPTKLITITYNDIKTEIYE